MTKMPFLVIMMILRKLTVHLVLHVALFKQKPRRIAPTGFFISRLH